MKRVVVLVVWGILVGLGDVRGVVAHELNAMTDRGPVDAEMLESSRVWRVSSLGHAARGDVPPVQDVAWQRCWLDVFGIAPHLVSDAVAAFASDEVSIGGELRLPSRLAQTTMLRPSGNGGLGQALIDAEVPVWRFVGLGNILVHGRALSLTHGVNACLPFSVRSLSMTPLPLVRGRTVAVVIETDRLTFCRAAYLGRSEPCYRDDENHLVVLVGISALRQPGTYPLRIELTSGGNTASLTIPIDVLEGGYGFQYIDPPPSLNRLMDAQLMASEAAYLDEWRDIRSVTRQWELPLAYPLPQHVSISADYGDRRSYGGMVDGYHSGVDYRAWTGLEVLAPADGVVIMSESLEMRGNAVLIDHGWGLITGYWHLSRSYVQVGDRVRRGQAFAVVGNTGLSTGSHLHWEVWMNGVSVDGKQWLATDGFSGVGLQPLRRDDGGRPSGSQE